VKTLIFCNCFNKLLGCSHVRKICRKFPKIRKFICQKIIFRRGRNIKNGKNWYKNISFYLTYMFLPLQKKFFRKLPAKISGRVNNLIFSNYFNKLTYCFRSFGVRIGHQICIHFENFFIIFVIILK
jgi:hypothetical protein